MTDKLNISISAKTSETVVMTQAECDEKCALEASAAAGIIRNRLTQELTQTDAAMARIAEDLIDVLIANGTIDLADFPQTVQDKLTIRKQLRDQIAALGA